MVRTALRLVAGTVVLLSAALAGPVKPAVGASYTFFDRAATKVGGNGEDILSGTSGVDVIVGRDGNDLISGLDGNDYLCGNSGYDTIKGGNGLDHVHGDFEADTITGNAGNDSLYGGPNGYTINGPDGDSLYDGTGSDYVSGDTGAGDTAFMCSDNTVDTVTSSTEKTVNSGGCG